MPTTTHPNPEVPPGQRLDLGGYHLHVYQAGSGQPSVIFEAGLGSSLLMWTHIQQAVAQHTHTLSYDRAGMGWSDNHNAPRTPEQITHELNQLLTLTKLTPPYILVGHSLGGLMVRAFAQQHPEKVKALVLVDSSYERQFETIKYSGILQSVSLFSMRVSAFLARFARFRRMVGEKSVEPLQAFFPQETLAQMSYTAGLQQSFKSMVQQMKDFPAYFGPNHRIPDQFGDLPLRVLAAAESVLHQPAIGGVNPADVNALHLQNQQRMAQMSTNGQYIAVPGATHLSIVANPVHAQYVTEAILQLL